MAQDDEDPEYEIPPPPADVTDPAPPPPAAETKAPPANGEKQAPQVRPVPVRPAAVAPVPASVLPYARPYRLAISLSFGVGSASLSRYHEGVDAIRTLVERSNPGASVGGDVKSNFQINAEFSFRYYFPYYLLGQVGLGAVYNSVSEDINLGPMSQSLDNHNLLMEVPILVGGYYTFIDRLYVHGAVGPSPFFFARSFWDPGSDFEADGGVGMHVVAGSDYMLAEHFALGLEVRYRLLKSGDLRLKGTNQVITSHNILQDGGTEPYYLDFSGVSVLLNLRFFAL